MSALQTSLYERRQCCGALSSRKIAAWPVDAMQYAVLRILAINACLFTCIASVSANSNECTPSDARVIVVASSHKLFLCEGIDEVNVYPVHLGRGGVGKTREGDGKVPLGVYLLGVPRPSQKYGTFIPIGYPTAQQRKQGYTGGSLGLHGPRRMFKWLGALTNLLDTTEGCVELASDEEIEQIAIWVRKTGAKYVEIR